MSVSARFLKRDSFHLKSIGQPSSVLEGIQDDVLIAQIFDHGSGYFVLGREDVIELALIRYQARHV